MTIHQFITCSMGYLSSGRYSADTGRIQRVVYSLREKYNILKGLKFNTHLRYPYSEDLFFIFFSLFCSRTLSKYVSSGGSFFFIQPTVKRLLRKRIKKYSEEEIAEMKNFAEDFEKVMKVDGD